MLHQTSAATRPPLLGIFYSVFDNTHGPKIRHQWPPNQLGEDQFYSISDYMITSNELCGRVITVNAYGLVILGCPMSIEDEKYDRNALLFNLGLVFEKGTCTNTKPFQGALRKIAMTFRSMETESGFLFDESQSERLQHILKQVFWDLNTKGECSMLLNEANMLNIKLFMEPGVLWQVQDHEVPVFLQDPELFRTLTTDLALEQVMDHIDGMKYAKRISLDANVDIAVVRRCLSALLYYEFIGLVDIFQYSNVYMATPGIVALSKNAELIAQCCDYVRVRGKGQKAPSAGCIMRVFCRFRPGCCVSDVILKGTRSGEIDYRRLVTFGVIHGVLRRVHAYPSVGAGAGVSSLDELLVEAQNPGEVLASFKDNTLYR
ncbi:unnamed protein product [Chrysoparadoxa australica]